MYRSFNARAVGLADLGAAATIRLAAAAGFEGVDLMVRDLLDRGDDVPGLRGLMDDLGLRGGAFPLPVAWKGDEPAFRRDLAALPRLAATARELSLARTATWVLPELPDASTDRAAIAAMHRRRLGAIARVLADHGIRLGLEAIGVASSRTGRGGRFVTGSPELFAELGDLFENHPNIGVLADFFHLHASGDGLADILARGSEAVVWVHVADLPAGHSGDLDLIIDEERGLPGDHGAVPIAELLRTLAELGYDGPVTAEPLGRCVGLIGRPPEEVALLVKAALDRCWPGVRR